MAETGRTGTDGPLGQHPRIAKRFDGLHMQPNLVGEALTLQLLFSFEMSALSAGLVSASER